MIHPSSLIPHPSVQVGAVVLAAGEARRMGCSKLTLEVDDEPIVHRVVRSMIQGGASPVVAVLGNHADLVGSALEGQPTLIVMNPDPSRGMLSSVQQGIRALPDDLDGFLVCPGDIALIKPEIVRTLLDSAVTRPEPILIASHSGKRGHPIYLRRELKAEALELPLTVGLNALVEKYAGSVGEIEVGDDAVLLDVDTPEDWSQLVGGSVSTPSLAGAQLAHPARKP